MSKAVKKVAGFALPVAGYAVGGPAGAAIGAGIGAKVQGGSWGDALKAGALNYVGGKVGSAIGSSSIGKSLGLGDTIGGALGVKSNAFNPSLSGVSGALAGDVGGSWAGNALSSVMNANLGSTLGSFAGNSMAEPVGGYGAVNQSPAGFVPKQQPEQARPDSLSAFGSLSPQQASTNIATQGVFGGGAGPQEQQYFLNLINRRLVDQNRNLSDLSEINPIENSYLSQLGLGGQSNTKSLLEAMSKWRAA